LAPNGSGALSRLETNQKYRKKIVLKYLLTFKIINIVETSKTHFRQCHSNYRSLELEQAMRAIDVAQYVRSALAIHGVRNATGATQSVFTEIGNAKRIRASLMALPKETNEATGISPKAELVFIS
jgi:hypothetical protein